MECSGVSNYDWLLLNISWISLTDESFQCSKIEGMLAKRKDAELVIKMRRIEKGCGVISDSVRAEVDGYNIYTCLCHTSLKHPQIGQLIGLEQMFRKGVLPFSGGMLEQPAQVMDLMNLMTRLRDEYDTRIQEKQLEEQRK